jgi:SAM-dependent methyltransferase
MNTQSKTTRVTDHGRIIRYFEAAGLDYAEWSRAFNMHFGYYRPGTNPFRLEGMLDEMTAQVYDRLAIKDLSEPLVLDLGCGLGTSSRYMANRHPDAQFVGATVTPWQVEKGNRLTEAADLENRVLVMEADYLSLPCRIESADATFAIESACYARGKDKWDFIDALHGTLKPGGRFAVADCFRRNTRPMPKFIDRAIAAAANVGRSRKWPRSISSRDPSSAPALRTLSWMMSVGMWPPPSPTCLGPP